jgi:DNA topoisomerase IA
MKIFSRYSETVGRALTISELSHPNFTRRKALRKFKSRLIFREKRNSPKLDEKLLLENLNQGAILKENVASYQKRQDADATNRCRLVLLLDLGNSKQSKFIYDMRNQNLKTAKSIINDVRKQSIAKFTKQQERKKIIPKTSPLNFSDFLKMALRLTNCGITEIIVCAYNLYENGFISYPFTENSSYANMNTINRTLEILGKMPNYEEQIAYILQSIREQDFTFKMEGDHPQPSPIIPISEIQNTGDLDEKELTLYDIIAQCFLSTLS